jgi:hypothetical protein
MEDDSTFCKRETEKVVNGRQKQNCKWKTIKINREMEYYQKSSNDFDEKVSKETLPQYPII